MREPDPVIFQEEYYQRLFEIESEHWWAVSMRALMDGLLSPALASRSRLRALDIGCGSGLTLHHLHRYDLVGEPIGLDYSAHALRFCRQRGATRLVLGSAVQPPLAANAFDLIICSDTIQHLSPAGADQIALQACARMLRPGGWLYLRTNSALVHRPLEAVDPDLYRRYDRRSLRIMVREAGLQIVRATYLNSLPSLWAALRERLRPPETDTPAAGPRLAIRTVDSAARRKLMLALMQLEVQVVCRLGWDLPFGHSLAILAQKPERG